MKTAMLMSGGVDSSVAAQLLHNNGVDFDPFYIKISMEGFDDEYSCTQEEDVEMASAVCHRLGKKLEIIDLHKEYWDNVVKYHIDKVKNGLTPNPDVMCNRLIKFGAFDEKTNHEYDKIATGHYATTQTDENGLVWLGTAKDPIKDQTDFLGNMTPSQVSKAIFPIGWYNKSEVREIAKEFNLAPSMRKDSQGICFLGKINYNQFVEKHLGINKGSIVDIDTDKVIGEHNGFWFHTIGQRKGLGLSGGPWFVVKKDIKKNIIYVSKNPEFDMVQWGESKNYSHEPFIGLGRRENINWCTKDIFPSDDDICWQTTETCPEIMFKIRHTPEFTYGRLHNYNGYMFIKNFSNVGGIAPGQFCTLYDRNNNLCYGCTEIQI